MSSAGEESSPKGAPCARGPASPPFYVARCFPDDVIGLRQSVLRPHQRPDEVRFARDPDADAAHFCACAAGAEVVGVVSLWPEEPPWQPPVTEPVNLLRGWRLRGMAVVPAWRGVGVGAALMAAAEGHVAGAGGGLLWCNARLAAVGFYERRGFRRHGEVWEEPVIGPHVAMWRLVAPLQGSQ